MVSMLITGTVAADAGIVHHDRVGWAIAKGNELPNTIEEYVQQIRPYIIDSNKKSVTGLTLESSNVSLIIGLLVGLK